MTKRIGRDLSTPEAREWWAGAELLYCPRHNCKAIKTTTPRNRVSE
jgi:hypothetical protein